MKLKSEGDTGRHKVIFILDFFLPLKGLRIMYFGYIQVGYCYLYSSQILILRWK